MIAVLGKAGLVETRGYYVKVAERAAAEAGKRKQSLLLVIDYTGAIVAAERPPSRKHWVVAEFSYRVNPDVLAARIERVAVQQGFDEGRRGKGGMVQ